MKVAFRVDASLAIGSGHVMRCLTVADAMRARGYKCRFLTRAGPGDSLDAILERGHAVEVLASVSRSGGLRGTDPGPPHAHWLTVPWQDDAAATRAIIEAGGDSLLVLDHYALDARWMRRAVPGGVRTAVFDDLADRAHEADILVDQNLGRDESDYAGLVPEGCQLLIGPRYALVDSRFAEVRPGALERRAQREQLRRILVSMGGVDEGNATGATLRALAATERARELEVTVVMGRYAPHLKAVRGLATSLDLTTDVVVDIRDMPERMAAADLAVGGAGGTAWERCAVGLPSIVLVLAENQAAGAEALRLADAAFVIHHAESLVRLLDRELDSSRLAQVGTNAAGIVDAEGLARTCCALEALV